jgi:hypothetical protein
MMNSLYDIVISVTVGGMILSMLVSFNGTLAEEGTAQTVKIMAQTNFTEVTRDLEYYLRKMGYGISAVVDSSILTADSNKIKFKGDFDNSGTVDTMTYYFNPAVVSGQANKNTHILYTTLNSQKTQNINIGITKFKLWYYDANGNPYTSYPVPSPSKIKSLRIALNLESTAPFAATAEKYVKLNPGVYWERTIKPKNLK